MYTITREGVVRCQFDMMIRFPDDMIRKTSNPYTQRGDKYDKKDPNQMLVFLLRYFINKHQKEGWIRIELYDNSKPLNSEQRVILKYEKGKIVTNRLSNYLHCFKEAYFTLPQWLY